MTEFGELRARTPEQSHRGSCGVRRFRVALAKRLDRASPGGSRHRETRAWIGGHGFLIDKSTANERKKRKSKG